MLMQVLADAATEPSVWGNMWTPDFPWWHFVFRGVVIYVFVLVILRLTGKRQVGQLAPFDLVLLLVLSNSIQNAMNGGDNSVTGGVISACTLVALNYFVGFLTFKSKFLEALIEGRPIVLVHNGVTNHKNMNNVRMTVHELNSALRASGCCGAHEVQLAVLENGGNITVIPKHSHPENGNGGNGARSRRGRRVELATGREMADEDVGSTGRGNVDIGRGIWVVMAAAVLAGQTEPADPLALLKQQEKERAVNATQSADIAAGLQRQLLGEKHGTNGAGAAAKRAPALAENLTQEQVRGAMGKGAAYLLKRLEAEGTFAGIPPTEQRPWMGFAGDQQVGVAGLAVYALIEAGKATGDPKLRAGSAEMRPLVNWLVKARTRQTYSAALQACALASLPQGKEVRVALTRIRDQLVVGMGSDGAYTYSLGGNAGVWDNSNTQYALLGMWAAAEAGVDVPGNFWRATDGHWRKTQGASGGWAYGIPAENGVGDSNSQATPALTAAGEASLYVTADQWMGPRGGGDAALVRGLAAVKEDFRKSLPGLGDDLYYTFALQRVGVAAGLKRIEGIDWYRRAAAAIILSQRPDGGWAYAFSEITGTSYALLVLAHGGFPAMVSKLEHAGMAGGDARDAAHLVRRVGELVEQPLNWQAADVAGDPADWLDAPVLLVTGSGDPGFDAGTLAKIGAFIHGGGMVLSVALAGDAGFTAAMEKDAARVTGYAGRPLAGDHALFTLVEKMAKRPALWGVSNGVRELWVHCPEDVSLAWEVRDLAEKEAWSVGVNLYAYATGKERPRSRLEGLGVSAEEQGMGLTVGRLKYAGNWDPEPGAWVRMGKRVGAEVRVVEAGELDALRVPVVHVTGTGRVAWPAELREKLAGYVAGGGTVIGDAAGGSVEFEESFAELGDAIAGGAKRETLGADDLLFSGGLKGAVKLDRESTEFRKSVPEGRRASGAPEVWGWRSGGRCVVMFSPLDVTSGLVGTETWGIAGYRPGTAEGLARDMLLLAGHGKETAATQQQ